jgi:chromosome segregation ATPase
MMSLTKELERHATEVAAKREAEFSELVNQLAGDGKRPSIDAIAKALESCGHEAADLEQGVEAVKMRRELLAKLARLPVLEAELDRLRIQGDEAGIAVRPALEAYEAACAKRDAIVDRLRPRYAELTAAIGEGPAIRARLRASYPPDGPLHAEAARAAAAVRAASGEIEKLTAAIAGTKSKLRQTREDMELRRTYRADVVKGDHEAAIAALEGRAADLAVELGNNEERLYDAQTASRAANAAAEGIDRRMGEE